MNNCNKCKGMGEIFELQNDPKTPGFASTKLVPCECRAINTRKFYCKHCTQEIIGQDNLCRAYYKIGDMDSIEEVYLVHEKCVKDYLNKINGLSHKCPKCNGEGYRFRDTINLWKTDKKTEVVMSSELYRHPGRFANGKMESVKDITENCLLCDGKGYLAKPPIPVITDWKKAP